MSSRGGLVGVALDPPNTRGRLPAGREFTPATDGMVYGVDTSRHVFRIAPRGTTSYRSAVIAEPRQLFRAPGGKVAIYGPEAGLLQILSDQGEFRRLTVPTGSASASWFGDLVAISTDSGIALVEQTPDTIRQRFIKVRGRPVTAAFSPSGHRIYVALQDGGIAVINRFSRSVSSTIDLGASRATHLRVDQSGRWLLAAPVKADTTWLIDLTQQRITGAFATPWREDLPTVVFGRSLLTRHGKDVVSWDLTDTPVMRLRLAGAAADHFIPVDWLPSQRRQQVAGVTRDSAPPTPETPPAADVAPPPPPATAAGQGTAAGTAGVGSETWYVQVSSSQNAEFAQTLSRQLVDAGYPSRVVPPANPEQGYRVVLGPYPSHEAADAVGRQLGRAYFVTSLEPQPH